MLRSAFQRGSSRFGRRLFALFTLSAIVPVVAAGYLLLREFNQISSQRQQLELQSAARGFGLALFDRLDSVDAALGALVTTATGRDANWLRAAAARLTGVRAVALVAAGSAEQAALGLNAGQRAALAQGQPALLWRIAARDDAHVQLVRQIPGGAWLVLDLDSGHLWGDIGDYTADAALMVMSAGGARLTASANAAEWQGAVGASARPGAAAAVHPADPRWIYAAWEVFLRSHYASDSLWVVAYMPRAPLFGLLRGSQFTVAAVLLIAVLTATLIASGVIRQQARRLGQLLEGTRRISRHDFGHQIEVEGDCEFAGLARSFNLMSQDLKQQFDALTALAEVDRLLQRSPDIEAILDRLLPSMARILHAWSVSVLLIDRDLPERARVYDHLVDGSGARPVRRIEIDPTALRAACDVSTSSASTAVAVAARDLMEPLVSAGAAALELKPLEHAGRVLGFLCVGHSTAGRTSQAGIGATDFADRLSNVLANLEQGEKLRHQAHYDSLTGLANRALFRERLQSALDQSRLSGRGGALLYVDLDQFKHVNDTSGHGVGDQFLCSIAQRIQACLVADAVAARLGGDEFAVLLPQAGAAAARAQAEIILRVVSAPVSLANRDLRTGASIGIALFPQHGATIDELLMVGDIAMYRAKETGRNRAEMFAVELRQRMQARAELEGGLRRALARSEFTLALQPIMRSDSGDCVGVEALLRWPGRDGLEGVSPAEFVPVAEDCGLIVELGDWVLRNSCRQFQELKRAGVELAYISVNVSAHQLRQEKLPAVVIECLQQYDMRPDELQIEITESVLADGGVTERTLRALARAGVRLALDDFGTGYSSLSYLRAYPVHTIKIDRSFVRDLPADPGACRLVEAMLAMAAAVNKQVVAEGVETVEQLRYLQQAGCGSLQGFLLGRPMSAVELLQRLLALRGQVSAAERRSA